MKNLPLSDRHNTNDEYETPGYIFDPLNEVFHFTLDVCATQKTSKVRNSYFNAFMDGLKMPWGKHRCWNNFPYSQARAWVKKSYQESLTGALVVCLCPGRCDTLAWHEYIWPHARAISIKQGRIKFVGCKDPAKFPSALAVFSPGPLSVEQMMVLATFGPIVQTVMRQANESR